MRLPSSLFSFSDGSIAMKNYVEKISEPQHYQLCVSRSCDLCGKTTNGDDWDKRNYNVNETEISVTVKHRRGDSWGSDGGSGDEYDIDICPECFRDRLVPWLISQGAKIKPMGWDW
jgi:hypothetical protein